MKNIINKKKLLILFSILALSSCSDRIDIENQDKISSDNFYRNEAELDLAINGCYNTLRAPIAFEWMLTEIRSDNTFMNATGTTAAQNLQIYNNDVYEAPRTLIEKLDSELVEMKRCKTTGLCCGAGGAQMFKEAEKGNKEINVERTEDALETNAEIIATGCPFCNTMMTDGVKNFNKEATQVLKCQIKGKLKIPISAKWILKFPISNLIEAINAIKERMTK